MTRAQQVLRRLREADGEWVDGTDLANEEVGGSEGLKRLRELRLDGWPIEERRHPNPHRAIWQYRLARGAKGPEMQVPVPTVSPLAAGAPWSPAVPSASEPRYECPTTGCDQPLRDVRPTASPDWLKGRCLRHGWKVVKK